MLTSPQPIGGLEERVSLALEFTLYPPTPPPQHCVSLVLISCCLCSLSSASLSPRLSTLFSVRSSKERRADPPRRPNASSRASSFMWESRLGSSWMVAMRGLSRGGGQWPKPGPGSEQDTGGVLVCRGAHGWKHRVAAVGGGKLGDL